MYRRESCRCECVEARVERFIQPCVLLLLAEQPSHGYDLMERLARFGFKEVDPGAMYRNLRKLEDDGFVSSTWETSGSGPARRSYTITNEGHDLLRTWAAKLKLHSNHIDEFLRGHAALNTKG